MTRAGAPARGRASRRRRVLRLEGELTIHTAADRYAALAALLDAGGDLELDLSQVTELDTAGLQLLLLAQRELTRAGARLTVSASSQAVADVLAIAHLDGRLAALQTEEVAR